MIIFKAFQGLENFYIKFQDVPYFSRICTNPASGSGISNFRYSPGTRKLLNPRSSDYTT